LKTTNKVQQLLHIAILDCNSCCTLPTFVRPQCVFLCQCTSELMRCLCLGWG